MEKISQNDIEWLLQSKDNFQMGGSAYTKTKPTSIPKKKKKRSLLWWLTTISVFTFSLVVLPFFIQIRTAVYLNQIESWNGWASLGGGVVATIVFLSILMFIVFRKVKSKKMLFQIVSGSLTMLVGGFTIYGLMYLNSVNAKSESVQEVYQTLHPILRVTIASVTLAENELVITDIKRTQEDYVAMGLTPLQSSMHYVQEDGFVHAIDLRTIGHSELRNNSLEWSLKLLGFKTIRHVGTADHLHVSLPVK